MLEHLLSALCIYLIYAEVQAVVKGATSGDDDDYVMVPTPNRCTFVADEKPFGASIAAELVLPSDQLN